MATDLLLTRKGEEGIKHFRHPWLYRSAVDNSEQGSLENGSLVRLISNTGDVLGWGFYSDSGLIAVRIFSFSNDTISDDWVYQKLLNSYRMRMSFDLKSNAYRLVNSEGDFFPGLIIDVYNSTVVVKPQIRGIELVMDKVVDAIRRLFPDKMIYLRRDERAARIEGLKGSSGYIVGEGEGREIIEEYGIKFLVDYAQGQKTGFYLDQRENRAILLEIASRKRVLNLFSYTGGFSLYSVYAGAQGVTSVESSGLAIEIAKGNVELNELDPAKFEWVHGDAIDFLLNAEDREYDIVVLDPPPFARRRGELRGAVRGYSKINYAALRAVKSGGFILTFSCSGVVEIPLFREIIFKQALRAGRNITVVRELHAPVDHPVSIFHPEGSYLKGLLLYVE